MESEEDKDYEEGNEMIILIEEIERVRYQNVSIITRLEQVEEDVIEYQKTINMLEKILQEKEEIEKVKDLDITAKAK